MNPELLIPGAIALIGAFGVAIARSSFDKVICLGLLAGGVIPFIVIEGYLDVAIAISLITPVTTIFLLPVLGRERT
ncbi:MAG: DUF2108 domain-containing protein [Methanoculleaceae archaeon]